MMMMMNEFILSWREVPVGLGLLQRHVTVAYTKKSHAVYVRYYKVAYYRYTPRFR